MKTKVSRALQTIERNVKLQAQLIDDLLDISRIVSGNLRLNMYPIDLIFVIEAAVDTVHLVAEAKNISIESFLDPTGFVLGDATRLQQVIWNLLANAIKFTPANGRIQVALNRKGDRIQIKVSDTGLGISAEFLPYVFDRFRQADSTNRHGGLGLGLALVRHLVQLHHGTVEVESPGVGQGATFTISLPAYSEHQFNQLASEVINA
jgi:signal transduction histidine kinase